jgi:hypothetical protein
MVSRPRRTYRSWYTLLRSSLTAIANDIQSFSAFDELMLPASFYPRDPLDPEQAQKITPYFVPDLNKVAQQVNQGQTTSNHSTSFLGAILPHRLTVVMDTQVWTTRSILSSLPSPTSTCLFTIPRMEDLHQRKSMNQCTGALHLIHPGRFTMSERSAPHPSPTPASIHPPAMYSTRFPHKRKLMKTCTCSSAPLSYRSGDPVSASVP